MRCCNDDGIIDRLLVIERLLGHLLVGKNVRGDASWMRSQGPLTNVSGSVIQASNGKILVRDDRGDLWMDVEDIREVFA